MNDDEMSRAFWAWKNLKLRSGLAKANSEKEEILELLASKNPVSEARAKVKMTRLAEAATYRPIVGEELEAIQKARHLFNLKG